jgi:hypothetical protein
METSRGLHAVSGYCVILPGHEIPDVEQVVKATEIYSIDANDGIAGPSGYLPRLESGQPLRSVRGCAWCRP